MMNGFSAHEPPYQHRLYHTSTEPAWVRNEHSPECVCAWCSPVEEDDYYLRDYASLAKGMSHEDALGLLDEIEHCGDTRISASITFSHLGVEGCPRYKLMLSLKGRTTWRHLTCRSPVEWDAIKALWEGL